MNKTETLQKIEEGVLLPHLPENEEALLEALQWYYDHPASDQAWCNIKFILASNAYCNVCPNCGKLSPADWRHSKAFVMQHCKYYLELPKGRQCIDPGDYPGDVKDGNGESWEAQEAEDYEESMRTRTGR